MNKTAKLQETTNNTKILAKLDKINSNYYRINDIPPARNIARLTNLLEKLNKHNSNYVFNFKSSPAL